MKKRIIYISSIVGLVVLIWGGYRVYLAHYNLVTLNVENADIREVVRSMEWQTWETILTHKDITGKVTIKVDRAPLESVLDIINDQIDCRWSTLYPLYSSGKSLVAFKRCVRGELNPSENGWTNLNSRAGFRRGGGGGFGGGFGGRGGGFADTVAAEASDVSFNFTSQDLEVATMALARFAQTQVVPEDGTYGQLNLVLEHVPVSKAVSRVAKQVNRSWDALYALQPGFRGGMDFGGGGGFRGDRADRGDRGDRGGRDRGPRNDTNQMDFMAMMQTNAPTATNQTNQASSQGTSVTTSSMSTGQSRMEQVMQTLPAEQRQQIEKERQQFEAMRQMPPEQRDQAMQEMRGRMESRMDNRQRSALLNTTPEQRVDRVRRVQEIKQRRQQQQQQQQGTR